MDSPEVLDVYPHEWITFTLQFEHKINVKQVWASLHQEEGDDLSVPAIELSNKITTDTPNAGPKLITVEFKTLARVPAVDGVYKLGPVYVQTYSGRTNTIEGMPEVRCRLHRDEPTRPPRFSYFSWD